MQTLKKFAISASLMAIAGLASATTTTLTFEGATGGVNNFYNGGTDQNGHTGPNVGITVTNGSAVITHNGGNSYGPPIVNEPSFKTVFWTRDPQVTFNKPSGFTSGFSLLYVSTATNNGTVNVYSGQNGTGTLLATFPLPGVTQCTTLYASYCNWTSVGATFAGVAQSVTVVGVQAPLNLWLDNVTFGSVTPLTSGANSAALEN